MSDQTVITRPDVLHLNLDCQSDNIFDSFGSEAIVVENRICVTKVIDMERIFFNSTISEVMAKLGKAVSELHTIFKLPVVVTLDFENNKKLTMLPSIIKEIRRLDHHCTSSGIGSIQLKMPQHYFFPPYESLPGLGKEA